MGSGGKTPRHAGGGASSPESARGETAPSSPSTSKQPASNGEEGSTAPEAGAVQATPDPAPSLAPSLAPGLDKVQAMGHALWLMMQSPLHRHLFVADLEWMLPPVALGQFRLWRQENRPIGFITWALVGPEVEERLRRGDIRLKPAEWKSGEAVWLMDTILPYGGADAAVKETKQMVFPDRPVNVVKFTADRRMVVERV
jgi:cytolysin-activating lysine-acyltransferase